MANAEAWTYVVGPAGLVGGYVLKAIDDCFKEARATGREARRLSDERALRRKERRESFERDTLAKLHDTLVQLNASSVDLAKQAAGAGDRWVAARGKITGLRVQVFDQQLRDLVGAFENVTQDAAGNKDIAKNEALHKERQKAFADVNDRLGLLQRQLYEDGK
jgi:hypothetical protein